MRWQRVWSQTGDACARSQGGDDVAAAAHRAAHRGREVGEASSRWIAVRTDAPPRKRAGVPRCCRRHATAATGTSSRPTRSRRAFSARARRSAAALRYLLTHGSRFLGVVRAGAFSLYGHDVGLDRARPGVRAERRTVPRGARRARPARAQPLRTSRRGDDARHVRRRRGCLAFADRAGVLSLDVPAAEQRRQRCLAGDAAAPRRQRLPDGRACSSPTRRRARGSRPASASPSTGCRRDSGRSRTRSSRTPIRSAQRSTSRGSRSIPSRCGSGSPAARTSPPSRSADSRCRRSTGPPARST